MRLIMLNWEQTNQKLKKESKTFWQRKNYSHYKLSLRVSLVNWFKLNNSYHEIFLPQTIRWLIEWYDQRSLQRNLWLRSQLELLQLLEKFIHSCILNHDIDTLLIGLNEWPRKTTRGSSQSKFLAVVWGNK
jgi:hypothetical protein